MEAVPSSRSPARCLAGAAVIAAMWWVAFENGDRVPLLTYVNLGLHEFGHFLTYAFSEMVTSLMGSIAQVAVPLALAFYFLVFRGDWLGAGLCLAWAATSALEVAVYVADAPVQELELIGGTHDWAFILGPDGYDAMDKAGTLADRIRGTALVAILAGLALCVASPFRGPRRLAQADAAAATSVVTPVSSPRAATATSGSAPRSASSPK